ncbi:MAG: N-acetylgalactosamine 6-sulfate sulfatase (GALNS), partial [Gemmataceae bacterium]
CGTGNGGSKVHVEIGEQKLPFTVEDTGGFQAFRPRKIGVIQLEKTGRNTLVVRPQTKANLAVMDIRQVRLLPVE